MRGLRTLLHALAVLSLLTLANGAETQVPRVRVLFLGDQGHHQPRVRFGELQPVLERAGVDLEYSEDVGRLSLSGLSDKDALIVYANIDELPASSERALLAWIQSGKGFVPLHCASFCFRNSDEYVRLVGAQFERHGFEHFTTDLVGATHPAMAGYLPFACEDETYVHHRHSADRVLLETRREGDRDEPWTWTRSEGSGRVFYTAWGHDARTWTQPGFHDLVERGVRWAAGDRFMRPRPAEPVIERVAARVPLYKPTGGKDVQGTMPKPLSPEQSRALMHVASGMEVDLVAAEPRIGKPLSMRFDGDGRLWLCETLDYPNELQPEGQGRDRLRVLIDEDGDGVYEKDVVYADKLSIPTSVCFVPEGVIVQQAPHTLLLVDRDGDLVCDERRILFSGWGTGDTHAGPSNLQLGFDGWVWGCVGYSGFSGEVGGKSMSFGQGVYRFRRDGSELQFLGSTTNNTWGFGLSEEGEAFLSTANHDVMMHLSLPNPLKEQVKGVRARAVETIYTYERMHPVTSAVRQVDWFGLYTAAAGARVYTHRLWPERYWNRMALVCEPTGKLVHASLLERDGSGWKALDGGTLLASRDEWFAPICAEVAPSGAVYVIDWYNYIIQHNPTPQGFENGAGNAYETPLRDKTHARIWRVRPSGARLERDRPLSRLSTGERVAALGSPSLDRRLLAQALLVVSTDAQTNDLLRLALADEAVDGLGHAPLVLHALHALAQRDWFTQSSAGMTALAALLRHKVPSVRMAAAACVPVRTEGTAILLASGLLDDPLPQVRRAACAALAGLPSYEPAGRKLYALLDTPQDRRLTETALVAAGVHAAGFLAAALDEAPTTGGAASQPQAKPNLLPNAAMDVARAGLPEGWTERTYSGTAQWQHQPTGGRDGGGCVTAMSTSGADSSVYVDVAVEPASRYELAGWVKTEGINGAMGALLNAHVHPDGVTTAVTGTQDWTRVSVVVETFPSQRQLSINLLLGGWGQARGRAWWDDVSLTKVDDTAAVGALTLAQARAVDVAVSTLLEREPEAAGQLLAHLWSADPAVRLRILESFARDWPKGRALQVVGAMVDSAHIAALDDDSAAALVVWLERAGAGSSLSTVRADLAQRYAARVLQAQATTELRVAAAQRLQTLDPGLAARTLVPLLGSSTNESFLSGLSTALEPNADAQVAELLCAQLASAPDRARRRCIELLLRRDAWHGNLLAAVESGALPRSELRADDRRRLLTNADAAQRARIERVLGASNAARAEVYARLLPAAALRGDAVLGRSLYDSKCAVCHRLGGQGGEVGPALDGMGKHPAAELLAEIVDPNRSVEANYRLWLVETLDEVLVSGRMMEETERSIELLDANGVRHRIERSDISGMRRADTSVMPEGLIDDLSLQEVANLLAFLATDGKR